MVKNNALAFKYFLSTLVCAPLLVASVAVAAAIPGQVNSKFSSSEMIIDDMNVQSSVSSVVTKMNLQAVVVSPAVNLYCGDGTPSNGEQCDDGRVFPTCSADGYPINYLVDPCLTPVCTDTDGGKDFTVAGRAYIGGAGQNDICKAGNIGYNLIEGYCNDSGQPRGMPYLCPNGCENGACIPDSPTVDSSDDSECGNGVLENGENCGEGDLSCEGNETCVECTCVEEIIRSSATECGNGHIEGDEVCDDGNTGNDDGCASNCLEVEEGWECDAICPLASQNSEKSIAQFLKNILASIFPFFVADASESECISFCEPICGDELIRGDEGCDDGDLIDDNECNNDCEINHSSVPKCGNGVQETGEQCDDGNRYNQDGCNVECRTDTALQPLTGVCEPCSECDETSAGCYVHTNPYLTPIVPSPACRQNISTYLQNTYPWYTCRRPGTCGNGRLEGQEQCDDGNSKGGDGCSVGCMREPSYYCPNCEGVTCTGGQVCTVSNTSTAFGGSPTCRDPNNLVTGVVTCSACGNGRPDLGEECDDGNTVNTDACTNNCTNARCGDGIVQNGQEWCDDGNTEDGDGCGSMCQDCPCTPACTGDDVCYVSLAGRDPFCRESTPTGTVSGGYWDICRPTSTQDSIRVKVVKVAVPQLDMGRYNYSIENTGTDTVYGVSLYIPWPSGVIEMSSSNECSRTLDNQGVICHKNGTILQSGEKKTSWVLFISGGNTCPKIYYNVTAEARVNNNTYQSNSLSDWMWCTQSIPQCGNSNVEEGEQCDDGDQNSDTQPNACRTDCTDPICGDNVIDTESGEECDEGDTENDDGCDSNCRTEQTDDESCSVCDQSTCPSDKVCYQYKTSDSITCAVSGLPLVFYTECGPTGDNDDSNDPECGDGNKEGDEECDDGDQNSDTQPNACRTDCTDPICGDDVTDTENDEQCDNGDQNSDTQPNACRVGCRYPSCGDNVIDTSRGEQCDDGARINGDGCSSNCRTEQTTSGSCSVCDQKTCQSNQDCYQRKSDRYATCASPGFSFSDYTDCGPTGDGDFDACVAQGNSNSNSRCIPCLEDLCIDNTNSQALNGCINSCNTNEYDVCVAQGNGNTNQSCLPCLKDLCINGTKEQALSGCYRVCSTNDVNRCNTSSDCPQPNCNEQCNITSGTCQRMCNIAVCNNGTCGLEERSQTCNPSQCDEGCSSCSEISCTANCEICPDGSYACNQCIEDENGCGSCVIDCGNNNDNNNCSACDNITCESTKVCYQHKTRGTAFCSDPGIPTTIHNECGPTDNENSE
ncbi:hypothetical protein KKF55_06190 [Patescibacteria group bacterium]|nr:hypothetical protein [Patescibacteria group bacterium]